jgi:[protein-PII] uridylyltransferase
MEIDFSEIELLQRQGKSAFETTKILTLTLDSMIKQIYEGLKIPSSALIALGGYGRIELCPNSDVDVMLLVERKDEETGNLAVKFFQQIWGLGINIGHSFRTIDECLELFGSDFESWASFLELRFVCGDGNLFENFKMRVMEKTLSDGNGLFIKWIINGNRLRHEKYGNTIKLLEPNIKKSAGGLRDIHTLLWILKSTDPDFWALPGENSACKEMLELMYQKGMINKQKFSSVVEAFEFLLRTRIELHLNGGGDVLDFNIQEKIANSFGYADENAGRRSVEVFMRDYYLRAREIYMLNKFFISKIENKEFKGHGKVKKIDDAFSIRDDKWLILNSGRKELTPVDVFNALLYRCRDDVDFSDELKQEVIASVDRLDFSNNSEVDKIFIEILNCEGYVAETLELMHELGILGKYIPEFAGLTCLPQHSVYHYFTVDEHTLRAVKNAQSLRESESLLGEVFRGLKRKDVLYLAILFHDIGKAIKVEEHSKIGAEIARAFLMRINFDAVEDVCFLVKNHLLFEQTAFRRNFNEAETLFSFVSNFENAEQLDLLYILTYADLSAVNPSVWTTWKAQLIDELYQLARLVIERKLDIEGIRDFIDEMASHRIQSVIESLSGKIAREIVENHFENLIEGDSYSSVFTSEEIENHIRKISEAGEKSVDAIFEIKDGYTEITVITRDAPFVLASICGVLSVNDANIFDAKIFTRRDGIVIDKFRVFDYVSGAELSKEQMKKIENDLNDLFNGKINLDELFVRHRRRWKRKIERTRKDVKIAVEFEDSKYFTIIDVFAPDSLGFLYMVSRKMSELGLNIYFAKISTRVDGIVDSFYVLDLEGRKIEDEKFREKVRSEILSVIYELNNLKLTSE